MRATSLNVNFSRRSRAFTIGSFVVVALLAATSVASAQTAAMLAQRRYSRGVSLYQEQRFAEALTELRASLEMFASPNTRLFIARSLARSDRRAEAVAEYQQVVVEAAARAANDARYADTRLAASNELAALEPSIGYVTIEIDSPPNDLRLRVAGREFSRGAVGEAIPVEPGSVRVEATAPGASTVAGVWDVAAGARRTVRLGAPTRGTGSDVNGGPSAAGGDGTRGSIAAPGALHPVRAAAWVAVGVAGAATASTIALALITDAHYRRISVGCTPVACPWILDADLQSGRTLETATNVMIVATAVLAAGSAIWAIASPAHVREQTVRATVALSPFGLAAQF